MRRSDREITAREEMLRVMERCDVCRVALNNNGYPYIVPLNFGMCVEEGKVVLYFHGATEGTKYELMKKDGRASFEMDCGHRLVTTEQGEHVSCTMEYESVIGRGRMEIVPEEEKFRALTLLMQHYYEDAPPFNPAVMPKTTAFRLVVEEMTGKRRIKRHG